MAPNIPPNGNIPNNKPCARPIPNGMLKSLTITVIGTAAV